jgi:hypothetical protein
MTKVRVWIEKSIIEKLRNNYENQIYEEFGFLPSQTKLIEIALKELEAYKENKEIKINFTKKGKKLIIK